MDRTAIERIEELSVACDKRIVERVKFPLAVLAGGNKIESLEQFQDKRNRFRAKFATTTLADFIDYVNDNGGKKVFISKANMIARTIFDMDDLGHCVHTAKCAPVKTPEYQAVCDINGAKVEQQKIVEFMEDWKDHIDAVDSNGDDMGYKEALMAMRLVTIEKMQTGESMVSSMSSQQSAMQKIEAKSGDKPLPAWIQFDCKPYDGLGERIFYMRLSITEGRSVPMMQLRVQNLAQHETLIANEMAELIGNGVDDAKCYLGSVDVS